MKTTFKYLLVLVLASFAFVGCAMNHCGKGQETQQFEYKVVIFQDNPEMASRNTEALNSLGKEGWMLVTILPNRLDPNIPSNAYNSQYYFKRLKH
jgi:Domain of unknown function (DUF4177)